VRPTSPPPVRSALAALAFGAALALAGAGALAGADPLADADTTVTALRQEAEQASQAYFDTLARMQALDAQAAEIEARLPALEAERDELRKAAERRAVAAYTRGNSQLAAIIDSEGALEAARRTQWLERLNARDDDSFRALQKATAQLQEERAQLRQAQQQQQQALAQLEASAGDIQAKLQAAEDRARAAAAAAAAAAVPRPVAPKGTGGAAPGPPPDYVPTPGAHPQHDQPFLVCTRARESGGNYGAYNPAGPYMGAYQFLQSTWNSTANHAGRPELIGVPPNTASEYDQDDMGWALYQWQGSRPWGGHCG